MQVIYLGRGSNHLLVILPG